MDILIDTQAFIWFFENNPRLPYSVKTLMERSDGLVISIASFWEIAIKNSLGKLTLDVPFVELKTEAIKRVLL